VGVWWRRFVLLFRGCAPRVTCKRAGAVRQCVPCVSVCICVCICIMCCGCRTHLLSWWRGRACRLPMGRRAFLRILERRLVVLTVFTDCRRLCETLPAPPPPPLLLILTLALHDEKVFRSKVFKLSLVQKRHLVEGVLIRWKYVIEWPPRTAVLSEVRRPWPFASAWPVRPCASSVCSALSCQPATHCAASPTARPGCLSAVAATVVKRRLRGDEACTPTAAAVATVSCIAGIAGWLPLRSSTHGFCHCGGVLICRLDALFFFFFFLAARWTHHVARVPRHVYRNPRASVVVDGRWACDWLVGDGWCVCVSHE
jgi:hypothetical protein